MTYLKKHYSLVNKYYHLSTYTYSDEVNSRHIIHICCLIYLGYMRSNLIIENLTPSV